MKKNSDPKQIWDILWDLWCVVSVVGIWPRFIEPKLVFTRKKDIPISDLAPQFDNFSVVYLSDFHVSLHTSASFLQKIATKVQRLRPDIILLGGDFLSYSNPQGLDILQPFLSQLKAPFGTFACLGNHDYTHYVTLGNEGQFVIEDKQLSPFIQGVNKLFSSSFKKAALPAHKSTSSDSFSSISPLSPLLSAFKRCQVDLLHNECVCLCKDGAKLQLVGLGDIMTNNCNPSTAFSAWDWRYPGVVLCHNPDAWPLLAPFPGNFYLFGHTHGGQINLPLLRNIFTPLRDKTMMKGLFAKPPLIPEGLERVAYVSCGVGSTFPFRWFSPPEISYFRLQRKGPIVNKSVYFPQALCIDSSLHHTYTVTAKVSNMEKR